MRQLLTESVVLVAGRRRPGLGPRRRRDSRAACRSTLPGCRASAATARSSASIWRVLGFTVLVGARHRHRLRPDPGAFRVSCRSHDHAQGGERPIRQRIPPEQGAFAAGRRRGCAGADAAGRIGPAHSHARWRWRGRAGLRPDTRSDDADVADGPASRNPKMSNGWSETASSVSARCRAWRQPARRAACRCKAATGWDSSSSAGRSTARRTAAAAGSPSSPGYFEVFRIPVKRGRAFNERDTGASPPDRHHQRGHGASVLAESDPLSDRLVIGRNVDAASSPAEPERQIIGIVGDVRDGGLNNNPGPTHVHSAGAGARSRERAQPRD